MPITFSANGCLNLPNPPELPGINLPQLGLLQAVRQSLYDLPDLSTYILQMQQTAVLGLAPLRTFLELIEVVLSIVDCFKAVIDSLLPPSPGPIINCLKKLIEAISRLAVLFPPFSYIKTIRDLCAYAIDALDQIIGVFQVLDKRLTEFKNGLINALKQNDRELAALLDCASSEIKPLVLNVFDLLKYIIPLIRVILEPIARLIPDPDIQKALDKLSKLEELLIKVQKKIADTEGPPVLDPLMEIIIDMRNIIVVLHNIMAILIGKLPSAVVRSAPRFANF